ncbi:hypothetical protein JRQ81_010657, partial [Phrynocephalus forsythii]
MAADDGSCSQTSQNSARGGQLDNCKIPIQLLYGIDIWIKGFNLAVEKVISSLLHSLFGLLRCASTAGLRLE